MNYQFWLQLAGVLVAVLLGCIPILLYMSKTKKADKKEREEKKELKDVALTELKTSVEVGHTKGEALLRQWPQMSFSPGVERWQSLQMVNSGLMVSWAVWVLRNVFSTRFLILAAGGRSSPTKACMVAPLSMARWNLL